MGFNINQARKSGFTIVELLIVVVVIAILAAITIVSYNGITTQANDSAAKSTASTFQKKAEIYYSEANSYPLTAAVLNNSAKPYHITTGFTYATVSETTATATVAADDRSNTSVIVPCGTSGIKIYYYNFSTGSWPAANSSDAITLGTGTCPTTLTVNAS